MEMSLQIKESLGIIFLTMFTERGRKEEMSRCPPPSPTWTGHEVKSFLQEEKNENGEEKLFSLCSHRWHKLLVAVE